MKIRSNLIVLALAAGLLWPAAALAAKGDCAQPQSNGSAPSASDCLFILKVAVGSQTCDPQCICAPKGTLPTTASDSLLCLRKSVGQQVTLNCPCASLPTGDNFNDNSKDPAKWGTDDAVDGTGVLSEQNERLEFTDSAQTGVQYTTRPWVGSVMPFNADWEVQIDVANLTVPTQSSDYASFGMSVFEEGNFDHEVYVEIYAVNDGTGFIGALFNEDHSDILASADTFGIDGLTTGALRVAYDAATGVLTVYYDIDPADGLDWVEFGSFGIAGSGGADGNIDWEMSSGDRFTLEVYGYAEEFPIQSGKLYGDNFKVTGGVEP